MRIMALDYGSKTVGVAVSDPLNLTAQGVEIIRRDRESKIRKTLVRIEELIDEYEVGLIVLGLPKNMDDSLGERAEKTLEFAELLQRRIGLEVRLWDERLTTVAAEEIMDEAGIKKADWKNHVDRVAASLILEDYMANNKLQDF